uniref:Putative zinc finger, CCHC-type n=1 Tax=Tanacetum cinerariifolium TaxID=118510 RepID=A0A6L2P4F5_TANCI|nr:putative zinc finger, CCHC-type [Tanacetum cinerariifolium]
MSGIEPLTGTNFSTWRDQVKLTLGVMDLDDALRIDPPAAQIRNMLMNSGSDLTEERLKVEKPDVVHVITTNSDKRKAHGRAKIQVEIILLQIKFKKRIQVLAHSKAVRNASFAIRKGILKKIVRNLRNECIKGKMTKGNKKGATRIIGLLELIHTDIYGPFPLGIGGHKSFITFIDDYLRYMYLFLINEKSESVDMFKTFKAKVENQLDHKIKAVISDRGGEYYGRHMDVGQALGSFFDFCKDHGIINQYTMPGTAQQNGVAERRNRTLMNMWIFHRYPERSKGYRVYWPSHSTRIVETRHVEFLENANNSGSDSFRRIELQEARDETPIIYVPNPISTLLDTSNDHIIAQDHPNNVKENEPNPKINVEPQETQ